MALLGLHWQPTKPTSKDMVLTFLDWVVILVLLAMFVGIGLWYGMRSKQSLEGYFLGGRSLPWWIAGTSMVATTFAADTPLLVTEIVTQYGISGNWLWWNMLAGGMMTTFFFARLWRKAGVVTDVELSEMRYSGIGARLLRGARAVYMGLLMNTIIMAWVNVAMLSLLQGFFGLSYWEAFGWMALLMALVAAYSAFSGLLGVVMTDVVQFIVAMVGCIILAVLVVNAPEIGGLTALKNRSPEGALHFFPTFSAQSGGSQLAIGLGSFFAFAGMTWWTSWYPGAEPGGGGYIAQRMMSTNSEASAQKAVLFFQIAHYAIRPWPWIVVALCATLLYPELTNPDQARLGFVYAMRDFLPSGLRGLLLVAFASAYMSTISTQLNWGTSYLVNDLYQRFILRIPPKSSDESASNHSASSQKNLVLVSRLLIALLTVIALLVTVQIQSIKQAWSFIIECGAGLGLVMILRWYWWRINAWSEIVAMIVPFVVYAFAQFFLAKYVDPVWSLGITEHPATFLLVVSLTTISWLIITFATPPSDLKTLQHFYRKIEPQGAWKPIRQSLNLPAAPNQLPYMTLQWVLAIILAYSILFGLGQLILLNWWSAAGYGLAAATAAAFIKIRP